MTASIHKLTAGSGYDYLTRQVARQDATEVGHSGLGSYYTAKGEAPGVWVGAGMAGIAGLAAGEEVTAEQMTRLFGTGEHPLGDESGQSLGRPFRVYAGRDDVTPFRIEVARRFERHNKAFGLPVDHPISVEERASIRTQVALEMFRAEHGRDPFDERELAGLIAKQSRPRTTAVAGFDLTFSPVKSVSTLWAVADRPLALRIEAAHQAAVRDALGYIEKHALFTRTGKDGVQQVDVRGMVAAAFTHRDSRAGDPDLHTHVAVANKVQTAKDGRWLSVDGRTLFKAMVSASEAYNTALEKHLRPLGITFAARAVRSDAHRRPVREIVGVDDRLNQAWSTRRASIQARRSELAQAFQAQHGRPPTPVESIQLAQQATLETRDAKHEPRSEAQQRQTWRAEALAVLGDQDALAAMVDAALSGAHTHGLGERVDEAWVERTAARVVDTVQASRSTWQVWHVRAEAQRRVRAVDVPLERVEDWVEQLTQAALARSNAMTSAKADTIVEPEPLRRADGTSVYTVAGSQLFTSTAVLQAEQRLVTAAGVTDGRRACEQDVDVALLESVANGVHLNARQSALVKGMTTSGARLQLAIAPAGSGKTTAMRALARAWESSGGTVVGLAPSAAAAAVLRENADTQADTLAKLVWHLEHDPEQLPTWAQGIDERALVVIDEAGMVDTLSLDKAVAFITSRGASVRLVGDDQQLAAVGAGGVLRDIRATHGALHLTELMRFTGVAEGGASLELRDGRPSALGFYLDAGRVHVGDLATMTEDVFQAWSADRAEGRDAIMLAPTRELVAELNQRARDHRLDGASRPADEVALSDGNYASVGDTVITRRNDRRLHAAPTDWVKNGDRWTVLDARRAGALVVQHTRTGRKITLPADYVAADVELGYASTVHTAQGGIGRRHPRPGHRPGVAPAALHDDDPRPGRQPRLPGGRRHRRRARRRQAGHGPPAHRHRPARGHPGPRRGPRLGLHPAAAGRRPSRPARPGHRPLRRRALHRRRHHGRHRTPPAARRGRRAPGPRHDRRGGVADPAGTPDPHRRRRAGPGAGADRRRHRAGGRHRRRPRRHGRLAPGRHRDAQHAHRAAAVDPRHPRHPGHRPDLGALPGRPRPARHRPRHRGRRARGHRPHPRVGRTRNCSPGR
ncbi:MobF family relaxase [uncultured Ornithinimicrobium sp.]|uniref:MobF family relaxase n=1 Tax=uncultured Ornithinimicrobium sp. TaxID=259307 RepID=UPI002593EEA6|nr:MobF family relaxase [uncultured Ornithinimicrobium sp.]